MDVEMAVEGMMGASGLGIFQWKLGGADDAGTGSTSDQFGRQCHSTRSVDGYQPIQGKD